MKQSPNDITYKTDLIISLSSKPLIDIIYKQLLEFDEESIGGPGTIRRSSDTGISYDFADKARYLPHYENQLNRLNGYAWCIYRQLRSLFLID